MPKTVRAAAVQIAPDLTSRTGTVERVLNAIAEAADKGAELIVFPRPSCHGIPISASFCHLSSKALSIFGFMRKQSRYHQQKHGPSRTPRANAMRLSSLASMSATTARSITLS